jgi:L-asparagine permease
MSGSGVPYGGIALTACVTLLGVGLNAVVPEEAFEIVLNVAALGILASWGMIVACQMKLVGWSRKGLLVRPAFRLPLSPWSGWLVMAFLVAVLVLMGFDYPIGTYTVVSLVVIVPALVAGWFAARKRVLAVAAEREGFTGGYPVRADRPVDDPGPGD